MKNISRTCPNCFGETKVYLVDLNAYNAGAKIKFKRCNWKKNKNKHCVTLLLDKIVIRI